MLYLFIGDKYMEDKIIDTMKNIGNKLNEEYLKGGIQISKKKTSI